ncbi:MFS transporter [Streptomyces sp. NBC_00257]|uniref:MFS transporter n=1 Tax=unclassified Streptomyces TaxID=2593676 RepID=UPI0022569E46|nr:MULTISPECIES: MFS transporter [unclassified Streptomyces]WTB55244.1 MFS transporter [Streptomyces sp. NBC_00826]WTH91872.1 MFS transporter [Streptomyces sp. NBC_00825]WTI00600.1 MFS transporter [Streptomyces sp. NBC_00822]MCX4866110.1 MFS transporter [Streptomyces sp. NBC_00906]MCX4897349.1 MFS transporter [Streptomyces sp. NBC_00892]
MAPISEGALRPAQRSGSVLACVSVCTALVVGFVAAINLAVPQLAASSLRPTSSNLLWIVDAYVVIFACLVIPAGAVGDKLGRKGVLMAGLGIFAFGAIVSAIAPNVAIMLIGRAITGLGAACVLPNCVGILLHTTAPERRSHALAIWAAATGIGGVVGNVGGGAVLSAGSWRALFAAVAFVAACCLAWAARSAPRSARHDRTLDLPGTLLFVAAFVALLIGIIEGPEQGWGSTVVLIAFACSLLLILCWVLVELRAPHPMLDPRLFRSAALSSAGLGMTITFFGSFGLFYVNASLLQYGRGFSVLQAGLGVIPLTVPLLVGTRYVPGLIRSIGIPTTLSAAFALTSAGLLGLSYASTMAYPVYAAGLFVIGLGIMLAAPCLTAQIASALPVERAGIAGGLQSATRELGSALGVAVVGTILTAGFTHHLPAELGRHTPLPRTVQEALTLAPADHTVITEAFIHGADTALRAAALVVLLAGALVVAGARRAQRTAPR